jgi:hypothetical protein
MTGFDTLMRSQSMMQQTQMGYDRMRYQMEQQAGQSLAQAPSNFLDGYKAAQDIRIQEQQAEMTARMSKLQITNLTEQTKQLQNQTAMGAIAVKKAQYELDNLDRSREQEIMRNRRDFVQKNTGAMMKMGYKPNQAGTGFEAMSPKEVDFYTRESRQRLELERQKMAQQQASTRFQALIDARDSLLEAGKTPTGGFDRSRLSEDDLNRLEALDKQIYDAQQARMAGQAGAQVGEAPAATAATQPSAAQPQPATQGFQGALASESPAVQQQFQSVVQVLNDAPAASSVLKELDSESAGSMMLGFAKMADEQVRLGTITQEEAAATVVDMFFNGKDASVQAYVMALANRSDDQIKAYLMSRPYMQGKTAEQRKAAAEFALNSVRQYVPAPTMVPASAGGPSGAATPQPGDPGYIIGLDQSMTASPASATTPDAQAPQGEQFGPSAMSAFIPGGPTAPQEPAGFEPARPDQVVPQPGPQGALSAPPTEDQLREFAEQRPVQPGQAPTDKTTVPPVTRFVGDMEASWPYANTLDEPFKDVTTQLKDMGVSSAEMMPVTGGLKKRVDSIKRRWAKAEERKLVDKVDAEVKKLGAEVLSNKLPANDRVKQYFKKVLQDLRKRSPANRADLLAQASEQLRELGPQVFDRLLDIQEENARQRLLANRLEQDVNMELARLKRNLDNARMAAGGPVEPTVYKSIVDRAEKRIEQLEKEYLKASGGK